MRELACVVSRGLLWSPVVFRDFRTTTALAAPALAPPLPPVALLPCEFGTAFGVLKPYRRQRQWPNPSRVGLAEACIPYCRHQHWPSNDCIPFSLCSATAPAALALALPLLSISVGCWVSACPPKTSPNTSNCFQGSHYIFKLDP